VADESVPHPRPDDSAQDAADLLAIALEEAGFDVGVDFPGLRSGWDESGAHGVRLGTVTCAVAAELTTLLVGAANAGVTLPPR
jgi:hypothetical protein